MAQQLIDQWGGVIDGQDKKDINDNFTELYAKSGAATTATAAELNYLDITTLGTGAASKAVVLDADEDYTWPATGVLTYGVLSDGTTTLTATVAELNILDTVTATAAELNYLDIDTLGTGAASKAVVLDADDDYTWPATGVLKVGVLQDVDGVALTASATELNSQCDASLQTLTAGTGFAGTDTVYESGVRATGTIIKTEIMIDLTGASSVATDLDIIGTHVSEPAHIGQLTAALTGATYLMGKITCLEAPAGGAESIDLYSATEGTGFLSEAIVAGAYTERALLTSGVWALHERAVFTGVPLAGDYLYLVAGGAVGGEYTAGKFLIEIWGY